MAKMKFRPLHDRVVVKRIDAEEKTAGGIIIPDTAKKKPSQGLKPLPLIPEERRAPEQAEQSEAVANGANQRRLSSRVKPNQLRERKKCQPKKSNSASTRATASCAVSTSSTTP